MCVLARGKPPGSGQSLPNKQSHSDERLIAIVFLFSKGRTSIPRARLQCGTGWLCLVAVLLLSSCRPRLTAAQSQEYLFSLLPPTHERTAGCRRPNTPPPCSESLPRSLLIPEEMKPRSVLNCQIPLSICFVAFPRGRTAVPSEFGSPTSPAGRPCQARAGAYCRHCLSLSWSPSWLSFPCWFHTEPPGCGAHAGQPREVLP